MRVLLSDGSGLTARQCATRLSADGHAVEVLSPGPMCLCRFTRSVVRVHRVPPYGTDPLAWLDAALDVYRSGRFDVLFPTQEQVAVLSWAKSRLEKAAVATAVPSFDALAAVQDKISASATMRRLGVPQPLLSVLGAAQHGGGHLGILAEVLHAGRRDHGYLASREELTPPAHDPKALVPLAMATAATVAVPRSWSWFTSGSVSNLRPHRRRMAPALGVRSVPQVRPQGIRPGPNESTAQPPHGNRIGSGTPS